MAVTPKKASSDLKVLSDLLEGYVSYFTYAADGPKLGSLSPSERAELDLEAKKNEEAYRIAYEGLIHKYANRMSELPEDYQKNRSDILKIINSASEPGKQGSGEQSDFLPKIKDINNKHKSMMLDIFSLKKKQTSVLLNAFKKSCEKNTPPIGPEVAVKCLLTLKRDTGL